ncbi:ERG24 reductase, partial [Sitta europaea]|nr:ERG24 reductase [Sitta europaea]
ALGLWIFHGATTQRSLFNHNPRDPRVASETPKPGTPKPLRIPKSGTPKPCDSINSCFPPGLPTVPTATGQVLLAGGWWGLVRRPDDLGELLMALGWTLPCGETPCYPTGVPLCRWAPPKTRA